MILQCTFTDNLRREMFSEIDKLPDGIGKQIVRSSDDILVTILGKFCTSVDTHNMVEFWKITCTYVNRMYRDCIRGRSRIV